MKKKLLTFILTLALWFVFAGSFTIQVFLLGIIVCSIISLKLDNNVIVKTNYGSTGFFLRVYYIFRIIIALIYDLFVSAFRVSRLAYKIKPTLSPRTISIKTSLKHVNSNAFLVNFITLPQGTLIVDFDSSNRNFLINWIDVHSDDEAEVKTAMIHKHENMIAKLFN